MDACLHRNDVLNFSEVSDKYRIKNLVKMNHNLEILIKQKVSHLKVVDIISQIAERDKVKVYAVGGFVRDVILNRERNDLDVLVIGSGIDFAKNVADKLKIENVSYYKNFGTAHFDYQGMNIEFVGARKESYDRTTRKPIVEDGTFEDDIKRRDFTINTLAISLNKIDFGKLIDTYNGLADIESKLIRTPLDPFKTFDDDPLRILRAFRFAAQLNFNVDESIMIAAKEMRERIAKRLDIDPGTVNPVRENRLPMIGTFHSTAAFFLRMFIEKL